MIDGLMDIRPEKVPKQRDSVCWVTVSCTTLRLDKCCSGLHFQSNSRPVVPALLSGRGIKAPSPSQMNCPMCESGMS